MTRPLRIDFPGAFHYVASHGISPDGIFRDDEDREEFLHFLKIMTQRTGIILHAYCLLPNHYHIVVETPEGYLSRTMQWLNQNFAGYMNRKYGRHGHLFQGRFRGVLFEADTYLAPVTRYVHLNVVRVKLIGHPMGFQWSSYRAFIGLARMPDWLTVQTTLSRFGESLEEQRTRYREYTEQGMSESPFIDIKFGSILGSPEFIQRAKSSLKSSGYGGEVSHLSKLRRSVEFETIARVVSANLGVPVKSLEIRGRKRNTARDIAIFLSRECTRKTHAETGHFFGGIRPSAVTLACKRIEDQMLCDDQFRDGIEKLRDAIMEMG